MIQIEMADQGKVIEGFAITKFIGQGVMGRVYQAIKEQILFAIKEIPKQNIRDFQEEADRELQILKLLRNNPNIIHLVQNFQNQEFYYLIFEYCNNESLEKYIKQKGGRLSEDQAIHFFKQILNGLQAMHEQKIIHGDISVKNILIHDERLAKISDFGCSKVLQEQFTITLRGTIGTIAPEIVQEQKYSFQADVFSIGSVLYYMIFGKYPFSGKSMKEYERNLKNQLVFDPQILISDELKKLLTMMLEKDQFKRITFQEIYQFPLIQPINILNPLIRPYHLVSGLIDSDQMKYNRNFYMETLPVLIQEQEPIESLVRFDDSQQVSTIIKAQPEQLVISNKGKEIIDGAFCTLQIVIYIWQTNQELEQLNFKNEKKILLQKQLLKYAQTLLTVSQNILYIQTNFLKTMDIALLLIDHTHEQTQRQLTEMSNLIANDQDRLGDEKASQIIQQTDLEDYLVSYALEINTNMSEVATNRKMQMQILIHLGTIMKFQYDQQFDFNLEEDFLGMTTYSEDELKQRYEQIADYF